MKTEPDDEELKETGKKKERGERFQQTSEAECPFRERSAWFSLSMMGRM